jgi:hypothetical protein
MVDRFSINRSRGHDKFFFRIIVIECFSTGGVTLKEASEHCFLSLKILFWCFGFIYYVVSLLFSALSLFSAIIIEMVPNRVLHGILVMYTHCEGN